MQTLDLKPHFPCQNIEKSMKRPKPTLNVLKSNISPSSVPKSITTHQGASLLHWVTCSFTTMKSMLKTCLLPSVIDSGFSSDLLFSPVFTQHSYIKSLQVWNLYKYQSAEISPSSIIPGASLPRYSRYRQQPRLSPSVCLSVSSVFLWQQPR